ncbi:terminase small subunit [Roseibium algicola]|uniref:terminase small subunit n=1 Tax=Roseibium algicola TaxID=2857014 RepID=UPI00345B225D
MLTNVNLLVHRMTPKQAQFVHEYLIDLNATQAAIRCGYSEKTAKTQASRLLANAEIAEAVDAAKIARSDRTEIGADWVLERLAQEAEADLADIYDSSSQLKPVEDWPLIWRQGLVSSVETVEERDGDGQVVAQVCKVRFSDRIRRLELIGKHVAVSAFTEIVNVKGMEGLADRLKRAARRTEEADKCQERQEAPRLKS